MRPHTPRLPYLNDDAPAVAPARWGRAARIGAGLRPWTLSLLLLPAVVYLAARRGQWTLLDYADLVIHEAGHVFFRVLGPGMGLAGGTLMQLLLPGVLAHSFRRHGYRPGVQLMLVWLGQSFENASVYAADARARELPLLGGDRVAHDWYHMLARFDLLHLDTAFGYGLFGLGLLCFVAALTAPRWMPDA